MSGITNINGLNTANPLSGVENGIDIEYSSDTNQNIKTQYSNSEFSPVSNELDSTVNSAFEGVLTDEQLLDLGNEIKDMLSDGVVNSEELKELETILEELGQFEVDAKHLSEVLDRCMDASDLTAYTSILGNL